MPKQSPDRGPRGSRRTQPDADTGGAIPLRPDASREREREAGQGGQAGGDEQLSSLLEELGGAGYRVRMDRKDSRGELEYLGTVDLTPDLLDDVRARWGGGRYRGRVVNARGGYERSLTFGIAGAPRDPEPAPAPVAGAAAPDRLAHLEAIVTRLGEQLGGTLARLERSERPDDLQQFARFATLMRELAPAATNTPAPAAPADPLDSLTRLLTFQSALEERMGPRGGGGPAFDVAALVRDGVKPLVGVLEKKIDLEREAMLRRGGRPVAVVEREAAAPAPAPLAQTPLALLVHQLPGFGRVFLANCARADKSAELYAETVLDQLPGDVVDALPELLAGDDIGERLAELVPEWNGHGAWFGELAAALLASLNPPGSDLEATG